MLRATIPAAPLTPRPQQAGTAVPPQVITLGLLQLAPGSQWMFFFTSSVKSLEPGQQWGQGSSIVGAEQF